MCIFITKYICIKRVLNVYYTCIISCYFGATKMLLCWILWVLFHPKDITNIQVVCQTLLDIQVVNFWQKIDPNAIEKVKISYRPTPTPQRKIFIICIKIEKLLNKHKSWFMLYYMRPGTKWNPSTHAHEGESARKIAIHTSFCFITRLLNV